MWVESLYDPKPILILDRITPKTTPPWNALIITTYCVYRFDIQRTDYIQMYLCLPLNENSLSALFFLSSGSLLARYEDTRQLSLLLLLLFPTKDETLYCFINVRKSISLYKWGKSMIVSQLEAYAYCLLNLENDWLYICIEYI